MREAGAQREPDSKFRVRSRTVKAVTLYVPTTARMTPRSAKAPTDD